MLALHSVYYEKVRSIIKVRKVIINLTVRHVERTWAVQEDRGEGVALRIPANSGSDSESSQLPTVR